MSDDSERFLERLTPRGAPPSLRQRALDGVARELADQPRPRRWVGAALAASLLLAVGLNLGLENAQQARIAEIYGPEPLPQNLAEVSKTVEEMAGEQTASWFRQASLRAVRPGAAASPGRENYWIDYYFQTLGKGWPHEDALENREKQRDRRRGAGGAVPGRQRGLDLVHGREA
jgi:hypothetical protein